MNPSTAVATLHGLSGRRNVNRVSGLVRGISVNVPLTVDRFLVISDI